MTVVMSCSPSAFCRVVVDGGGQEHAVQCGGGRPDRSQFYPCLWACFVDKAMSVGLCVAVIERQTVFDCNTISRDTCCLSF